MKVTEVTITPAMAKKMLSTNGTNRKIKRSMVLQYANNMRREFWKPTGDTIKISSEGALLDGQHRLHAIIESDTTVKMLVASDLDPSVFTVLDTGTKRNLPDVLYIAGYKKHTPLIGSIVRGMFYYDKFGIDKMSTKVRQSLVATNDELLSYYEKNESTILEMVDFYSDLKLGSSRPIMSRPKILVYRWIISLETIYPAREVDLFIRSIITGTGLEPNSPALMFRNIIINKDISKEPLGDKLKLALLVKAWNNHIEGKEVKYIKIPKLHIPISVK